MASDQRYRVIDRLESGGMAEVFRAEALGLQGFKKQVAIKRVLAHLAKKETFIKMFLDEARLSARLSHSNCVQVFDIGVGDDTYFIVMEFVDGANLRGITDTLKGTDRSFPAEEAVYTAIELCKGLQYAHQLSDEQGNPLHIVHRDMSPPNVLVTKHGEVKIVDFGLAKANTQLERSEPGIIKGKFGYLSPEAAKGREVDSRADIFAIGIMLWEMLAGRRLFLGKTDLETVQMVQRAVVPPISHLRRDIAPEIEAILNRALAADPARRYGTARELGVDLNAFLYTYGQRPVTDFEISELVYTAMEQRRREREVARSSGGVEQFLEWADQALLQFQSLEDTSQGSKALDAGAFGVAPRGQITTPLPTTSLAWREELHGRPQSLAGLASRVPSQELSTLEDDNVGPAPSTRPLHELLGPLSQPGEQAIALDLRSPKRPAMRDAVGGAATVGKWVPPGAPQRTPGLGAKIAILTIAIAGVVGALYASGVIRH